MLTVNKLFKSGELFKLYNSYKNDDFKYGVIIKYLRKLRSGDEYYQCLVNNNIENLSSRQFRKV